MRSRFVMSMIRLVRADILVMDEWIGTADGAANTAIGQLQRELVESASLLLLASHSERVLREWVDTIVWLDAGEVRAVGPTDAILPEYQKLVAEAVDARKVARAKRKR
jgi:ABC-2 type transport system ATP-binding protein/lipopolysaccharide transport system ATP-binding protein